MIIRIALIVLVSMIIIFDLIVLMHDSPDTLFYLIALIALAFLIILTTLIANFSNGIWNIYVTNCLFV